MGTRVPETPAREKDALQRMVEDLRTETSERAILEKLKALMARLYASDEPVQNFLQALQAGGLPTLIRHLRGTATSGAAPDQGSTSRDIVELAAEGGAPDQASTSCDIAELAAEALGVLHLIRSQFRLDPTTSDIPPLLDALLRGSPSFLARCVAANELLTFTKAQPTECRAIMEGGGIGLLLRLYDLCFMFYYGPEGPPPGPPRTGVVRRGASSLRIAWQVAVARPVLGLVRELVCSETGAAEELRDAILSPQTTDRFSALVLMHVRHPYYWLCKSQPDCFSGLDASFGCSCIYRAARAGCLPTVSMWDCLGAQDGPLVYVALAAW